MNGFLPSYSDLAQVGCSEILSDNSNTMPPACIQPHIEIRWLNGVEHGNKGDF